MAGQRRKLLFAVCNAHEVKRYINIYNQSKKEGNKLMIEKEPKLITPSSPQ